ncbi:MAG: hypothetical protein CM15mP21_0480 [Hyphomicrobiales bacterium]|nr:MAG: hypothetical protein CM15mP21_0480 [Hyphomicrobiales bacterium]
METDSVERELALIKVSGKGEARVEALRMSEAFRARVVDATPDSFVFELTGRTEKIDAFIGLMRPLGLKEVSRTGCRGHCAAPRPCKPIAEKPIATHFRSDFMNMLYDRDVISKLIKTKKVAIIGYGSQGPRPC